MSSLGTTQLFVPPGQSPEVINMSKTQEELPLPASIQGTEASEQKLTGKRQRVAKSPKSDLKKACNTPVRKAKRVFQSLLRNEQVSEDTLRKVLGESLFQMVAQRSNPVDALRVALVEGADPNHNDPVTALYLAVDNDNEEYCKLLLENGASIVRRNKKRDVDTLPVTKALSKSPSSKIYKLFVGHIRRLEEQARSPLFNTQISENGENQPSTPLASASITDESPDDEPPKKRQRTNE